MKKEYTETQLIALRKLVSDREEFLDAGMIPNARALTHTLKMTLNIHGFEFCSHNLAILGSKRDKNDMLKEANGFLTFSDFKKLQKELAKKLFNIK